MQILISWQNMKQDSLKPLPLCFKLCCVFFSVFWLQGRRGFPKASVIQRSYNATFLWWGRKNQGWDYCSPGNRKSECLTFFSPCSLWSPSALHTYTQYGFYGFRQNRKRLSPATENFKSSELCWCTSCVRSCLFILPSWINLLHHGLSHNFLELWVMKQFWPGGQPGS